MSSMQLQRSIFLFFQIYRDLAKDEVFLGGVGFEIKAIVLVVRYYSEASIFIFFGSEASILGSK